MSNRKKNEQQLRVCQKKYEQLKEQIQKIGFIYKGSLLKRYLPCGNPICRCHKDPKKHHGPFYQISWKDKAKTVSHFVPPGNVAIFRQWLENRHQLMSLLDEMQAVSRQAGDCIRAIEKSKNKTKKKPKNR